MSAMTRTPSFESICEVEFADIFANARGSIKGSSVLREAYASGAGSDYRIDIVEQCKSGRLQLYEFKKVATKREILTQFYCAFGQTMLYGTMFPRVDTKRIVLVTDGDFSSDRRYPRWIKRFEHVQEQFGVVTGVFTHDEIWRLKLEDGYRRVPDDESLRTLLGRLDLPKTQSQLAA